MARPDVTAEKVFATALRLPAGPARNSFLQEEIGANADLLQAVEQMLELHEHAGSFLELTALERDPSLLSGWNAHPDGVDLPLRLRGVWAEGSADRDGLGTIGHFKVLRLLGYGGFSIVLLAEDELLGRQVALKVLAPEIAKDTEATQRFLREARSTAAIRDKHVVQVYEVGEQAGVPYLVMEYLPAGSLQSLLRTEGNLSIKDGLSVLIQVAEALHATHRKGILHRDVKPSNVLIDQFPDRVKLSDFGLAHSVHDSGPEPVVGTPQFSSPEQLRGELVDHRTDLFSLGCLAYALLAGQSPFAGVSRIQTVQLTLGAEPEPLTRFGLQAPQELECLLQQLVAKRPAQRPSHVLEVLNRLQSISASLDRQPGGSNLTLGNPYRPNREQPARPKRSRREFTLAGLGAIGLGTVGLGTSMLLRPAHPTPTSALLSVKGPINLSLFDRRLDQYLLSSQHAVLIGRENECTSLAGDYWRVEESGKVGVITYRFPFERPLTGCRLLARGCVAFGSDAAAWLRISVSADQGHWHLLQSLRRERSEYWLQPAGGHSTPLPPESFANRLFSPMPRHDLGALMRGQSILYLRAEIFAVENLQDDEGGALGPAAAQFLPCGEDEPGAPLQIVPDV